MNIPTDMINKPKKSLGYAFSVSTASVKPITGREWVYTATDEQIRVLRDVETLFEGLINHHYEYAMREVHTEDGQDGWTLSIYDKATGKTHCDYYEGFPHTAGDVLRAIHKLMGKIREGKAHE